FFTVRHNVFERGKLTASERCSCMAARRESAPRLFSNYEAAAVEHRADRVCGFVAGDCRSHAADAQTPHTYGFDAACAAVAVKATAQAMKKNVLPLIASGRVKPPIDSTFPLKQASAAHTRMESGRHIGKIVLTL